MCINLDIWCEVGCLFSPYISHTSGSLKAFSIILGIFAFLDGLGMGCFR